MQETVKIAIMTWAENKALAIKHLDIITRLLYQKKVVPLRERAVNKRNKVDLQVAWPMKHKPNTD